MSEHFDVLVTLSTFSEYSHKPLELLEGSGLSFRINASGKRMTPAEIIAMGDGCRAVIAGVEPYSDETLSRLLRLECISRVGVGIDSIDQEACRRKGIAILNTPDPPAIAVAELTLAAMLGLLRRLVMLTAVTRARKWQRIPGNLLAGKTVGIVGLGRIGRRVAKLVQAFGADVVATDPVKDKAWASANDVSYLPIADLLGMADILSLHAAGGSSLHLGASEIGSMKPGALLINMARGDMIDDVALAEAITNGHIAGAALDVFPQEPYAGPLCDSDRVILTPHEATLTIETRVSMETQAVENLLGYFSDRP